jgi:hypothetical protein
MQDKLTGFQGICVAYTRWLNGCERLTIQPEALDNMKLLGPETFDESQCFTIKGRVYPAAKVGPPPGGDRANADPGRLNPV